MAKETSEDLTDSLIKAFRREAMKAVLYLTVVAAVQTAMQSYVQQISNLDSRVEGQQSDIEAQGATLTELQCEMFKTLDDQEQYSRKKSIQISNQCVENTGEKPHELVISMDIDFFTEWVLRIQLEVNGNNPCSSSFFLQKRWS